MNVFGTKYYDNDKSIVGAAKNITDEIIKKYPEIAISNYIESNYPKNYDEWIPYFLRQIELSKPFLLPEFVDLEQKGIPDVSPDIWRSFHRFIPHHEDQSLAMWLKILKETLIHITILDKTIDVLCKQKKMPIKLEHLEETYHCRRLIEPFGNTGEEYGFHQRTKARYKIQKKFLEDIIFNFEGYCLSTKWVAAIIRDIIKKQLEERKLTKEGNARLLDEIDGFGVFNYYRYELLKDQISNFNSQIRYLT
jgi:hypothetical protein